MSHSSGIPVSASLENAFREFISSSSARFLKIQIDNDQLVDRQTLDGTGGAWEDDLELLQPLFEIDRPAYFLFRKEPANTTGGVVLFCYVPDKSKVKDKMVYASTRATLKLQLGSSIFIDEVFGTVPGDFSLKGYKLHVASKEMEAPLTESEFIKKQELESGEIHVSAGASSHIHGVAFPVDSAVTEAVNNMLAGQFNYVQVAIDTSKEQIILDHTDTVSSFDGLRAKMHTSQPRFHFYVYAHTHEGEDFSSTVYIYSCPDGSNGTQSARVRGRMLYSSSKANVANLIPSGHTVGAKVEINTGADLSEESVLLQLHPKQEEKAQGFAKPSRPGKGGRRLIRDPTK